MSTIYVFQDELSAVDALAEADSLLLYDTSSGRTKKMTGSQSQDKVVTTETTATALANTGISVLGNTTTATQAYLLAGKFITNASLSTLSKTVTVASTASGYSSLTKIGTSDTIVTFTGANQGIELYGLSTTKWQVVNVFGTTANPVLS
jgi:hypothetical protein